MSRHALVFVILMGSLLAACAKPVPPEKIDYVGQWSADNVHLAIHADGTVNYKRVEGNSSTTINAPIQAFDGPHFSVGVGLVSTTFVVSAIPHQEAGTWKMIVDGVELTRRDETLRRPDGGETVRF